MFSDKANAETCAVHLGRAGRVAEPGRRLRNGAKGLFLRQGASFTWSMHHAATPKSIAFAQPNEFLLTCFNSSISMYVSINDCKWNFIVKLLNLHLSSALCERKIYRNLQLLNLLYVIEFALEHRAIRKLLCSIIWLI